MPLLGNNQKATTQSCAEENNEPVIFGNYHLSVVPAIFCTPVRPQMRADTPINPMLLGRVRGAVCPSVCYNSKTEGPIKTDYPGVSGTRPSKSSVKRTSASDRLHQNPTNWPTRTSMTSVLLFTFFKRMLPLPGKGRKADLAVHCCSI